MTAEYTTSLLYPGNPYVEALPPMLAGQELIRALASVPPYSTSDRDRSTGERLQLLSALYEFYQPLTMTLDLYCEVYNAMQHCYGQYTPQREATALQQGYAAMQGKAVAASIGGGNSFSVVGVSGLGKSTALQRVLSLFPQIIHHERYKGQMLCCQQIPYLVVQTPHDGSVKAMILDIYLQLDTLLGTSYQHYALAHKLTLDVLVSQLNQIVRINHVGLLVIDELQNIAYRKNGIRFINFLVQLINGAGVSICMVGTPRVLHVLQQEFRSARRTTGLIYDRLPYDKEFALLLHGLWHYQYTRFATDLTPEMQSWLYRKTQGIPDVLVKLLYNAQKLCILDGREKLDFEVFESAYHNKRFKSMAEAHGLEVEHHPKYGWTITSPGVDLLDFIKQQGWQDLQMVEGVSLLDVLGTLPKGGSRTKKPSSTRKYICPKCGNSCRATKAINIICGDCMDKMIVAE